MERGQIVGCRGKDELRIDLGLTTLLVIALPPSARLPRSGPSCCRLDQHPPYPDTTRSIEPGLAENPLCLGAVRA